MLAFLLLMVFVLILVIVSVLIYYSPGKPEPFLDENGKVLDGSISEKTFKNIGGIRQGMFIKSKNKENPILLYLHGGIPDYFLTRQYPTGLEDYFTVVWWEQRGSGLSFNTKIPIETMNLGQLKSDTKEVTNYLRNRFEQEKIYLMGRSGGTFFGIQVAAEAPELYHAYIGIGQMSNQLESERQSYEHILKKYRDTENWKMVRKLETSPVTHKIPYGYLKLRDRAMHRLGIGTTQDMESVLTGLFIPSLTCKEYTLKEKFNLWRGKAQSGVHPIWDTIITTNLPLQVNEVNTPVYLFHGIYDYTVSYTLAKQYFKEIKAPVKGFYTFQNSAHSPHFEEPQAVRQIIEQDVLYRKNNLADEQY